eukprot:1178599-Prorocentrum_minimum.AAC.3
MLACCDYACCSKFYHEDYMSLAKSRTDLGIRLVAVNLSSHRLPPLKKSSHPLISPVVKTKRSASANKPQPSGVAAVERTLYIS